MFMQFAHAKGKHAIPKIDSNGGLRKTFSYLHVHRVRPRSHIVTITDIQTKFLRWASELTIAISSTWWIPSRVVNVGTLCEKEISFLSDRKADANSLRGMSSAPSARLFPPRGFVNINDAINRCSSKKPTTKNAESFYSAPPNEPKYNGRLSIIMVISLDDEKKAKNKKRLEPKRIRVEFLLMVSRTHIHWRCLVAAETSGWRTVRNCEDFKSRVFTILRFHGFHSPNRAHWQLGAFWFSRVCRRASLISIHFHSKFHCGEARSSDLVSSLSASLPNVMRSPRRVMSFESAWSDDWIQRSCAVDSSVQWDVRHAARLARRRLHASGIGCRHLGWICKALGEFELLSMSLFLTNRRMSFTSRLQMSWRKF